MTALRASVQAWLWAGLVLAVPAQAQTHRLEVQVNPASVCLGETAQMTLTLTSPDPMPEGLGDITGLSTDVEIVNRGAPASVFGMVQGQRYYQVQQSFDIRPKREGAVSLAGLRVRTSAGEIEGNEAHLNVMPPVLADFEGGERLAPPLSAAPNPRGFAMDLADPQAAHQQHAARFEDQLYLLVCADAAEPYVRQQVNLSVYLVNGLDENGNGVLLDEPQFRRSLAQAAQPAQVLVQRPQRPLNPFGNSFTRLRPEDFVQTRDPYTQRPALVRLLERVATWPTETGEITLGEIQAVANYAYSARSRTTGQTRQYLNEAVLTTRPITLRVRPLPGVAPGAPAIPVGRDFQIETTLTPNRLAYDEAATLRIRLTGHTRPEWLDPPAVDGGDLFSATPPPAPPAAQGRLIGDRFFGVREFEYLVRFDRTGHVDLPPIAYPVFDVGAGRLVTLRSDPISVEISDQPSEPLRELTGAATAGPGVPPAAGVSGDVLLEIEQAGFEMKRRGGVRMATETAAGLMLLIAPVGVFAAGLVLNRRRAAGRDAGGFTRRARREAARHLRRAGQALRVGDHATYHAEIAAAVHGHLSEHLGQPTSGLAWPAIDRALEERGVEEALRRRLNYALEQSDLARFAPGAQREAAAAQHGDIIAALRDLGRLPGAKRGGSR